MPLELNPSTNGWQLSIGQSNALVRIFSQNQIRQETCGEAACLYRNVLFCSLDKLLILMVFPWYERVLVKWMLHSDFYLSFLGLIAWGRQGLGYFWSMVICFSVFRKKKKYRKLFSNLQSSAVIFKLWEWKILKPCWDDSNWYFLVKHSFYILLPFIL